MGGQTWPLTKRSSSGSGKIPRTNRSRNDWNASTASCSRNCAPSSPAPRSCFGFLLAIRFTGQFTDLNTVQRSVYYATLVSTAVSLVLLLAPSAYHRVRFREGDKDMLVRKGNREAIAGTGAIALAFTGVLYLIADLLFTTQAAIAVAVVFFALTAWRWWVIALYRKARERAQTTQP